MIVTVNLAKGAMAMSRAKVIVKRLNTIQNFGAMDVLCTDKTGTSRFTSRQILRAVLGCLPVDAGSEGAGRSSFASHVDSR